MHDRPPVMPTTRLRRARALAPLAALALAACASPYSPPLALDEPKEAAIQPPELAHAIAVARQKHAAYRAKVVELGESEAAFSNGMLGLGTAILGLVTADAHVSAIRGATLGAGAIYTTGRFNTDRQRGAVHLDGMAALECAMASVQPLSLNVQSAELLQGDRQSLAKDMGRLVTAMGAARHQAALAQLVDASFFAATVKNVDDLVAEARVAQDAAATAQQLLRQRLEAPTAAAVALRTTVDAIDRQVLLQLEATRPSLASILDELGRLKADNFFETLARTLPDAVASGPAEKAGPAPAPHGAAGGAAPDAKDAVGLLPLGAMRPGVARELTQALGDLQAQTAKVRAAAGRVNESMVGTMAQVSAALAACKVEQRVQPLSVKDTFLRIPAGQALTQQIHVAGGNGLLRAGFTRKPVPGLTVNVPPGTQGIVEVQATAESVAGSYPLVVEDTTMTSRVTVTVVVAPTGTDTPGSKVADNMVADSQELADKLKTILARGTVVKIDDTTTVTLQAVTVREDGAVEVDYSTTSTTVTPEAVDVAIQRLPAVGNLGIAPRILATKVAGNAPQSATFALTNALTGLDRQAIRRLQAAVCVAPDGLDGLWGPASQRALVLDRAQRDPRQAIPTGALTATERDQLLALTDDQVRARCAQRARR